MCARKQAGKADITPTLVDLERTHIIYVNAHFKPFAAIGYEYNKVRPQSGSPTLGSGVTFSIPQFGDFFHDIVVRTRLGPCQSSVLVTPVQAAATTVGSLGAVFPANGFLNYVPTGATDNTYANAFYNLVDHQGSLLVHGTNAGTTAQYRNLVRYCEYPGNRLFRHVKFDVNGNPLDEYHDIVPIFLTKFCLAPNKVVGYKRLVGQEVALEGYSGVRTCPIVDYNAAGTPANMQVDLHGNGLALFNSPPAGAAPVGNFGTAGAPIPFAALNASVVSPTYNSTTPIASVTQQPTAPVSFYNTLIQPPTIAQPNFFPGAYGVVDYSRQALEILDGPQTPKPEQPTLEIWNPLRFWFNEDVRLSIASVSIPFGQRFITIEMNCADKLVFEFPNLYLETIIDYPAVSGNLAVANTSTFRTKTYTPIFQKGVISAPAIERMEMYVNNIFVNPEVHDIFIKRIGFSLIRVYREQVTRITTDSCGEMLLSQLKWPTEYLFVGMRPSWNIAPTTAGSGGVVTAGNPDEWRDWDRMTKVVNGVRDQRTKAELPAGSVFNGGVGTPGVITVGAAASNPGATSNIGQVIPDTYAFPVSTVNTLSVTAHGITIYDNFQDVMYNSYLPFHYGGPALNTPDDRGALFVNFALFPRSYQPSGHLNISRARETYIKWDSSYISPTSPADLLVVAVAINFLLVTDGSAVLRYST